MPRRKICTGLSLEQIDDFFSIEKPIKDVETIFVSPEHLTSSEFIHADSAIASKRYETKTYIPPYKRHSRVDNPHQTDYAKQYQEIESQLLLRSAQSVVMHDDESIAENASCMSLDLQSLPSSHAQPILPDENAAKKEEMCKVYKNYNFATKYDNKLPIHKYREEIINTIDSNQVTVIEGTTGSGKTTQVPQYILDSYAAERRYCNIIVTQPRRIAAITIARRVTMERRWPNDTICGYQIGLEDPHYNEDTRILYCTTGILLKRIIANKNMNMYTHVILDEVHERDSLSDFCLLVVRKLLHSVSRFVKVVLMSATIDSQLFASYFPTLIQDKFVPAPILKIEGRLHTVQEFFLDDLRALGETPFAEHNNPCIESSTYDIAVKLIQRFDIIEGYELGEDEQTGLPVARGAVLVFLPGIHEISVMKEKLKNYEKHSELVIFALHSSITSGEQNRIFDSIPASKRKIILSTNIAESSITIPDIKYVIDFCLTKELICDTETSYSSLQLSWASGQNCTQRKGRAGRVQNGRAYFMVTREFYKLLPAYGVPEMQRSPLHQLILKVKMLDLGEPKYILGLALSPPNLDDIEKTIVLLLEIGALTTLADGVVNPHDGCLTFLGRILAELPIDIRLGKLILLGYVFNALEQTVIIAAGIALKSCFVQKFDAKLMSYWSKYDWSDGTSSDCFAMLYAYKAWKQMKGTIDIAREQILWCQKRFLDPNQMNCMERLIDDTFKRLQQFGISIPRGSQDRDRLSVGEEKIILKMLFAGAFYPNYFLVAKQEEQEAVKAMSGYDPHNTVMVRNIPKGQGGLYKTEIEKKFRTCQNKMIIHFEESKAFIEFPRQAADHKFVVSPAVLKALKMRLLHISLNIRTADEDVVSQHLRDMELEKSRRTSKTLLTSNRMTLNEIDSHLYDLPQAHTTTISITPLEIIDCGHFWAQYEDKEILKQVYQKINTTPTQAISPTVIVEGMYCLSMFKDSGDAMPAIYRARVEKLYPENRSGNKLPTSASVFFVDYGNEIRVNIKNVLEIRPEHLNDYPFQAFQIQLTQIRPNPIQCPDGQWTPAATKAFHDLLAMSSNLWANVYSVVNNIVRVELHGKMATQTVCINDRLVERKYAEKCDESWQSKCSNEDRIQLAKRTSTNSDCAPHLMKDQILNSSFSLPASANQSGNCPRGRKTIRLKGPENPFEVSFYAMGNNGKLRQIKIENDSVNSVVVDDSPGDAYARLMVAGNVRLDGGGEGMLLGNTTIMPNIRGLPAMAAMLFCPVMELRTDKRKTRLTGALCGLGWDDTNHGPMLPEHDMEVTFDTKVTTENIKQINNVRMAINIALGARRSVTRGDGIRKLQGIAVKHLLELIRSHRDPMDEVLFYNQYEWHQLASHDIEIPNSQEPNDQCLYKLHHNVILASRKPISTTGISAQLNATERELNEPAERLDKQEEYHELKNAREHIKKLKKAAIHGDCSPLVIECELCQFTCNSRHEVSLHITTNLHKRKETNIQLGLARIENTLD